MHVNERGFLLRSLLVVAVAIAARLFFVVFDPFMAGDSYEYQAIALNLIGGHGYAIHADSPTVYRAPVYPLFVAGVYGLLGPAPGNVLLAQVFVGALGAWATYLLGVRVFGERAGLLGGLLGAADPHVAWYAGTLLAEALSIVLLSVTLLGGEVVAASRPRALAIAVGAGFGAIALSSPALAAMPAAYLVVLLLRRWAPRDTLRVALLLAVGYGGVLAPWVVRNAVTFDAFVPLIVPQQGLGIWLAAARVPLYDYDFESRARTEPILARWRTLYVNRASRERELLPERLELQRDMIDDGLQRIAAAPGAFLQHRAQVIPALWISPASYASLHSFRAPFETQNLELGAMRERGLVLPATLRLVSGAVFSVGLIAAALAGLYASRRAWRRVALLAAPTAYTAIFHSALWIEFRYSLPAHPTLWLLAGAGVLWVLGAGAAARRRRSSRTGSARPA